MKKKALLILIVVGILFLIKSFIVFGGYDDPGGDTSGAEGAAEEEGDNGDDGEGTTPAETGAEGDTDEEDTYEGDDEYYGCNPKCCSKGNGNIPSNTINSWSHTSPRDA